MYVRMCVRTCVCWPCVRDVIHKCTHVEQWQAHIPYWQALYMLTYVHMYACNMHPFLLCRIIQYYVMREDAGTLAPASSEQHKVGGGEGL